MTVFESIPYFFVARLFNLQQSIDLVCSASELHGASPSLDLHCGSQKVIFAGPLVKVDDEELGYLEAAQALCLQESRKFLVHLSEELEVAGF